MSRVYAVRGSGVVRKLKEASCRFSIVWSGGSRGVGKEGRSCGRSCSDGLTDGSSG